MWTAEEKRFFRSLKTPDKVQRFLDELPYNPTNTFASPRLSLFAGDAHCFEGAMLAGAALEFQGMKPLVVNLLGHRDDHHIIAVYRTNTGWGSIAKSNTTSLRGRHPFYRSIRELVMSYFDFYFNVRSEPALYAYTDPVDLNRFNRQEWRWSEHDLEAIGIAISSIRHFELASEKQLERLPKVSEAIRAACFLGADESGLYQP